ncbi:MAG: hypothetical protein PSN34_06410 [Urechidicola sp.]|nr:hypothetical protein [Urechidicola sp.]
MVDINSIEYYQALVFSIAYSLVVLTAIAMAVRALYISHKAYNQHKKKRIHNEYLMNQFLKGKINLQELEDKSII